MAASSSVSAVMREAFISMVSSALTGAAARKIPDSDFKTNFAIANPPPESSRANPALGRSAQPPVSRKASR